ncbi:hypothetical protein HK097_004818, partial [Rhizophlyctis rosea]
MALPTLTSDILSAALVTASHNLSTIYLTPSPHGAAFSGALTGLALSVFTIPIRARAIPESLPEHRLSQPSPVNNTVKNVLGWAAFSLVYQGLRTGIVKGRLSQGEDPEV